MRYLTYIEVAAINHYVIERFSPGEQIGIKSPSLLDSAVNRPKQSTFGTDAYRSVFDKTGALFQSIAQNHAFHNGNKPHAFLSFTQFLSYNEYHFEMVSKIEQADFTVNVGNKKYTLTKIVATNEKNSSRME